MEGNHSHGGDNPNDQKLHRVIPMVQDLRMAVFCAVCERLMTPGDGFSLQGQYVVHRHCAGGTIRTEAYLASVRAQISQLDVAIATERRSMEREIQRLQNEIRDLRLRKTIDHGEIANLAQQVQQLMLISTNRAAEITRLNNEVLRLQSQGSTAPMLPAEIAPDSEETQTEPEDATSTRFGLLEFD